MLHRTLALALLALAACTAPQPCPSPLLECGGRCVDVESDRRNCGGCGIECPTGEICFAGGCSPDLRAPCPERVGGAFVTLGHCGAAVKMWIRDGAFVDEAAGRVGADTDPAFVPSLAVLPRADCDAQWSWHVDPSAATTTEPAAIDPASACTRCPAEIQPATPDGAPTTTSWCPVGSQVLSVERRAP